MYRLFIRRLGVLLSVSLAAAIGNLDSAPAAPVPAHLFLKEPPSLFPVRVGTKWVYDTPGGEHARVVAKAEEKNGAKLVTIESGTEKRRLCQKVSVSEKGVFLIDGSPFVFVQQGAMYERPWCLFPTHRDYRGPDVGVEAMYERPWCLFPTPLKVGDKWDANVVLEGGGVLTGIMQVAGTERVKVPAGTYDATRIDWKYSIDLGPKKTIPYWYAQGVGLIQAGDPPCLALKSVVFAP